MKTKIIKLKEAIDFVRENRYAIAVYKLQQNNKYILQDELYLNNIDENIEIEVEKDDFCEKWTNFEKFVAVKQKIYSVNKEFCFILHFNLQKNK